MEALDIVIHKGDKEEKYQLYVEDYVMSYLKNYRTTDSGTVDKRKIFFYGEKKPKERKYYIYGAGRQSQIPYFEKYELLEEITCHYVMDMPVFSVRENSGTYELAGYYIFYQSNDAMQSYMVEQRKNVESEEKEDKSRAYIKSIPKSMGDIKGKNQPQNKKYIQKKMKTSRANENRSYNDERSKEGKAEHGLMTLQLSAIFIIIAAIVINSTNNYAKLRELGQAAVEVFFVMENQDAAENGEDVAKTDGTDGTSKETVLRLSDLDEKFAKENNAAKPEEEKDAAVLETETKDGGSAQSTEGTVDENKTSNAEGTSSSEQAFSRNITEYYRIEKGDTLYTISIKIYGDSSKVAEICELNQITNPDHIEYGQKILLP